MVGQWRGTYRCSWGRARSLSVWRSASSRHSESCLNQHSKLYFTWEGIDGPTPIRGFGSRYSSNSLQVPITVQSALLINSPEPNRDPKIGHITHLLQGASTLYSPWWGNQASRSYFLAAALFKAPKGQLRLMEWSRVALWPRKKYPRQWRPHDMGVLVIGRILRLSVSFHKTKFQRYSESPSEVAIIWSKASQLPSGFVKTNC